MVLFAAHFQMEQVVRCHSPIQIPFWYTNHMALLTDENAPNVHQRIAPFPYMDRTLPLLLGASPLTPPLDQSIEICIHTGLTTCYLRESEVNCATVIVANHRYIDEQNMGGGEVSICYSKSTKPYHASMYLPGVCGWGNGDMREEQTLQESGKLAHSEERAPCVRKERNLSLALLG